MLAYVQPKKITHVALFTSNFRTSGLSRGMLFRCITFTIICMGGGHVWRRIHAKIPKWNVALHVKKLTYRMSTWNVARFQAKLVLDLGQAAANVKIRGSRCLPVTA